MVEIVILNHCPKSLSELLCKIFKVKIWFQNNRYKCKQKQKEDERTHKNSRNDSIHVHGDSKYNNMLDSPCSSGNDLSMNSNNSPDASAIKIDDQIIDNVDIKPIQYPDVKDPSMQNPSFSQLTQMYHYSVPNMGFYYNPAAAASYQPHLNPNNNPYQPPF